jgi:glycosyltransferase involved in cell wall biosynthesis
MDRPAYSIVIPAYNEGERITATLDKVLAWLRERGTSAEIVVVNDGSRDNTADIIRRYAASHPQVRLVENPGNRGKGFSVRNGMTQAQGDLLLFTDADLSSPITEAPKLFDALAAGADVAIGSRWLRSDMQTERQPVYRQLFGRIFNLFLRIVLGIQFKDTQCGFKAFRRSAADAIFPRQRIERWGFDAEILFLARRFGFKSVEIGVVWGHDERTKISYFRDGMKMVWEVLLVRWYAITGKYDRPVPAVPAREPAGIAR